MAQTNGQAANIIQSRDGGPPKSIKELLNSKTTQQRMQALVPEHMNPGRLLRVSALTVHKKPGLLACTPMSLLGAIFQCAELGMEPDTPLQHCHLVPFKVRKKVGQDWVDETDVQVIIGYRGYIDLARRSGLTSTIHADAVYTSDIFSYSYGSKQHLNHEPRLFDLDDQGKPVPIEDRGELIGFYSHCHLTGGEAFKVLPLADVIKTRDEANSYKSALALKVKAEKEKWKNIPKGWTEAPWVKFFPSMGRKTTIRALAPELPLSIEMNKAISLDDNKVDYAKMAQASDQEIVDLDPSHWQYEEPEEDDTPKGDPAGDEGPARVTQGADPTIDGDPAKQAETVDPGTGEVTETKPAKARAPRGRGKKGDAGGDNLFGNG